MADEQEPTPTPDTAVSSPPEEWGEDISPDKDGKVFKKILVEGSGGEGPGQGDEVSVHYTGRLLDGTVFDSSVERNEQFKFKLGEGKVIKGWDTGVATMKKGEKCLLTCAPDYAYGSSGSPPSIPPNATLQFEVELFSWQGEDITKDGGVIKSLIKKGEGYVTPSDGATVNISLKEMVGERMVEERDVEFTLGEGCENGVTEGIERALSKMKKEESCRLTVQAQYAYGASGHQEKGISPGETLNYVLTLNSFNNPKASYEYSEVEDRITDATALKDRGTSFFKNGKFALAHKLYSRAASLVDSVTDEEKEAVRNICIQIHLNIAACSLKLKDGTAAKAECDKVLELDDANVKAYFRKGQAHMLLHDYPSADTCFKEVLKLESGNKAAMAQHNLCLKRIKEEQAKEKKMYRNIFAKLSAMNESEPEKESKEEKMEVEEKEKDIITEKMDAEAAIVDA